MAVVSTEVQGRRKLRFRSFDDVLADAHRIHEGNYEALGNWSLGQALKHLGSSMHFSVNGVGFPVSWKIFILGRLVFRPVILYWRFPPGAKLPPRAERAIVPSHDTSFEEGLRALQGGIDHLAADTTNRVPHPVIGNLSVRQWNRFHLRHAELHLSFFVEPKP